MTPNPIIFRRIERRDSELLVFVDEVVRGETIEHALHFDERTFAKLERVFTVHPFQKKAAENDSVLFRGLETPLGDSRKYLGLQIVNGGSRHHLKIEASDEVFGVMKGVLESWSTRIGTPNQTPHPTPL